MLTLDLNVRTTKRLNVLCLGAHCDDIEIGCGGTLLRLVETYRSVVCRWVVFSSDAERALECQASANSLLETATEWRADVLKFRDGFLPFEGAAVKEHFERLKADVEPDLIFTHYQNDRHQDHRLISELTWNTFRDHLILEYEVLKYDGDLGQPNVFVLLGEQDRRRKVELLLRCYKTQVSKRWFTESTFNALMRIRGIECGAETGYAEAFFGRKLVL